MVGGAPLAGGEFLMSAFDPLRTFSGCGTLRGMNAKLSDWLKLGATVLVVAALSEAIALLMNFTGDCGPGVEHCGETARQASFVVLGLGFALALCLVVRFVRAHRR